MHRIDPHPHRGFEPVTFVYRGSVYHRDSLGNEGTINAGEVQWITSGAGIVHSEGPVHELQQSGGVLELIQLWVNLPAAHKMTSPTYQELRLSQIPRVPFDNGRLQVAVVSGSIFGVVGPAHTRSTVVTAMGAFEPGMNTTIETPAMKTFAIYVLNGILRINDEHNVQRHQLVVFSEDNGPVHLSSEAGGDMLILGGDPLNEPVAQYGPFVMNTHEELEQAFIDYRDGKMGTLDY
jgi:redox-sensitive bicupin YhaK (pirin superfamily)